MEHFALPTDALAIAKRQGRLHRNFQGYSTQSDCDLIALGVSAIGKIGTSYAQNSKILNEYYDLLDQGLLPVVGGLVLSRDDVIRRLVIMSIMCRGQLEFESYEQAFQLDFAQYFDVEIQALAEMQLEGLLHLNSAGLQVTADGWFFVHTIAMVFDKYLQADRSRAHFSRIL
jgi:oxygen-independent coproporphyrinogen-3 oxidase